MFGRQYIYMESSARMLVRAREREHGARGRGRSLESFPLLKEVIGEREVRRKEGRKGGRGEKRREEE